LPAAWAGQDPAARDVDVIALDAAPETDLGRGEDAVLFTRA
jgi:hypothetical protein